MDDALVLETNKYDVMLGRGNSVNFRAGNIRFRTMAAEKALEYTQSESKEKKEALTKAIVETVKNAGGRFLRPVTVSNAKGEHSAAWEVVSDDIVYTKAKQAMRDAASNMTKNQKMSSAHIPSNVPWSSHDQFNARDLHGRQGPQSSLDTGSALDRESTVLHHQQLDQHQQPSFGLHPPLRSTIASQQELELLSMINAQQNDYRSGRAHLGSSAHSILPQSIHQLPHIPSNNTYHHPSGALSRGALDAALDASLRFQMEREELLQRQLLQSQLSDHHRFPRHPQFFPTEMMLNPNPSEILQRHQQFTYPNLTSARHELNQADPYYHYADDGRSHSRGGESTTRSKRDHAERGTDDDADDFNKRRRTYLQHNDTAHSAPYQHDRRLFPSQRAAGMAASRNPEVSTTQATTTSTSPLFLQAHAMGRHVSASEYEEQGMSLRGGDRALRSAARHQQPRHTSSHPTVQSSSSSTDSSSSYEKKPKAQR